MAPRIEAAYCQTLNLGSRGDNQYLVGGGHRITMFAAAVKDTLIECASALDRGELRLADLLLKQVLDLASLQIHRVSRKQIKFFAETLVRNAFGLHPKHSSLIDCTNMLRFDNVKLANDAIENAIIEKPHLHLHIIDMSAAFYPRQWKDLILRLGLWSRSPPLFRLSRIVLPNQEEIGADQGDELRKLAGGEGIAFEFNKIVVNSLDEINPSVLGITGDDLVVVNFFFGLDNHVLKTLGMEKVLFSLRGLKPEFLVIAERYVNVQQDQQPNFPEQLTEMLKYQPQCFHYSSDLVVEQCYRIQIINMARGDGGAERNFTLSQWQHLLNISGFFPVPIKCPMVTGRGFHVKEENGFVMHTAENKFPIFFLSVCKLNSLRPVPIESTEVGLHRVPSKSDILRAVPLIPKSVSMIRMASLAEIYDLLQYVCSIHNLKALTWASCSYASHPSNQRNSQFGSFLCVEDFACYFPQAFVGEFRLRKCHVEKGKGHVGKSFESDQPFYISDILQLTVEECPYNPYYFKHVCFDEDYVGVLVVKLKSLHAGSGDYVVEFFLPHDNTIVRQKALIDNILGALKSRKTKFVTCHDIHGPLVELHENAMLDGMLAKRNQVTPTIFDIELYTEMPLNVADAVQLKWLQEQVVKCRKKVILKENLGAKGGRFISRIGSLGSEGFRNLKRDGSKLDQGMVCSDMARWIVKCKVSQSIVEHESFKTIVNRLKHRFDLKSEKDLASDILRLYEEEKDKISRYFAELPCRLNMTLNLWEDGAKEMVYCCFVAHFINDSWELKNKVLCFNMLEHGHGVTSLCEMFKGVLLDYNIHRKVCSLTIHNASSCGEIVQNVENWPSGIFYLSYDKCIPDIGCWASKISLASIFEVYENLSCQQTRDYPLMNVASDSDLRICSLLLALATVFHPQLRFSFVEFAYEKTYKTSVAAEEHLNKIFSFLKGLYNQYAYGWSKSSAVDDINCSAVSSANGYIFDSFRKHMGFNRSLLELHSYLGDDVVFEEANVLNWWRNNSSRLPTLGKMARDFLSLPWSTNRSGSALTLEVVKIISICKDPGISTAAVCLRDWLVSPKGIGIEEDAFDEEILRGPRTWSKKDLRDYLVSPFTEEELKLLENCSKMDRQIVGINRTLLISGENLASLLIPINSYVIEEHDQLFFYNPWVVDAYFDLLTRRYKKFPDKYLKHYSLATFKTGFMFNARFDMVVLILENFTNARKLFIPIYLSHHWILLCVDTKDEKLIWLDPLKSSQMFHDFESQIISEWLRVHVLPDLGYKNASDWPLIVRTNIPTGKKMDSGIFIMKYADCLTHGDDFPFSEPDIPHFRKRIFIDLYQWALTQSLKRS